MQKILINEEMTLKARAMSNDTLRNLPDRPNYTGVNSSDRYFTGYLGELVFEEILKQNKKKYLYVPKTDGKSDNFDFIIYAHRPLKVDTKTSANPDNDCMMIPAIQFDKHIRDIYVAIKLYGPVGVVHGWCFRKDFILKPEGMNYMKVPTMFVNYRRLFQIEALFPKLEPSV